MLIFSSQIQAKLAESDFDIIITGGGGWLGLATLEMLHQVLGAKFSRVHAFGSAERLLRLRSGVDVLCKSLSAWDELEDRPCIVAHYAFLTKDVANCLSLADYIAQNEALSAFVQAQVKKRQVLGLCLPSSGAVYNSDRSICSAIEKNPYGVLKIRDEEKFSAFKDKIQIVIPRVFNLAGPYINKISTYALSSILSDIAESRPVRLRAEKPVYRSYVHVQDLVDLCFSMMLDQSATFVPPFDTAGDEVVELGELAERAITILKARSEILRPPLKPEMPDRYVGDGAVFRRLCTEHHIALKGLDRQILDTAEYLHSRIP